MADKIWVNPLSPEAQAKVDAVVAEVLGRGTTRNWIMRKHVAKIDAYVVNVKAPVTAEYLVGEEVVQLGEWPDMAAFEAWYDKKRHSFKGVNYTDQEKTFLHIEPIAAPAQVERPAREQGARAPRQPSVKKWYICNSHLALAIKAAGFSPWSNADDEPLTFRHPAGHEVVIKPCAPDKKSSSDWILKLAGKEPEEGRGLAIRDKLEGIK